MPSRLRCAICRLQMRTSVLRGSPYEIAGVVIFYFTVMTLADFALAAHLSALDYLGDIDWETAVETRNWYARLKSRPAFRTLLNDRVGGMPPHAGYADLDF